MHVDDAMVTLVRRCYAEDTLNEVARRMWEHGVGVLPVIDYNRRPIAMITDRDICLAAYTQGKQLAEIVVRAAMSEKVYACHVHDSLATAERVMASHRIRRLPVINDMGMLVGIVSRGDLNRARKSEALTKQQSSDDASTTLGTLGIVSTCRRA